VSGQPSRIIVNTGDGKGKSSAAVGVMARAWARGAHTNVVVTGRDAPQALVDLADTVTDMRKVKHAFDVGLPARKGLEY
jgi:ATP:corrinoid adenosyltransferase